MVTDEILVIGGLIRQPRLQKVSYDPNDPAAEPLTAARIALTYAPGGPALPFLERVYSVGHDPADAIRALGERIGWGEITGLSPQSDGVRPSLEQWYCRFYADGTSMKAAGRYVPGGVILTWWK